MNEIFAILPYCISRNFRGELNSRIWPKWDVINIRGINFRGFEHCHNQN